jgi:Holliday junction resolvase-like predicted endonuclease
VAIEPAEGPAGGASAARLLFVEVRSHTTSRYGLPEESVDRRKVARLYRGAQALMRLGRLPDGSRVPRLPWRVDVVAVDLRPSLGAGLGGASIRHIRAVTPD